jgi:hypothetical protein
MTQELVIFNHIETLPAFKPEDSKFLMEHKEHLHKVLQKTHIWRTDTQKNHIINDVHFPTVHAKFHQAILEQKVQFEQSLYLAKDFELKKIEIEEIRCDLEELKSETKRDLLKRNKLEIELKFKHFELQQMSTAMHYRMAEVRGWQRIIDDLYAELITSGVSEESIWDKNEGEFTSMFFVALNNAVSLHTVTDSGEKSNIIAALSFVITQAKRANLLGKLKSLCSKDHLDTLAKLGL